MKNLLFILLFSSLMVFVTVPQAFAVTEAEASVGNEELAIGSYDLSNMTEEEQEWFLTFLRGNFFADGWEQISSNILLNTLPQEREQQESKLKELGYKIGQEWCKDNDIRKIHTAKLKKWGRELRKTVENTPHLLPEVLQRIDKEVDALLN